MEIRNHTSQGSQGISPLVSSRTDYISCSAHKEAGYVESVTFSTHDGPEVHTFILLHIPAPTYIFY